MGRLACTGETVTDVMLTTVKVVRLCVVPPVVVTRIMPEGAPTGTFTTSCVDVADCTGAVTPPIMT